MSRRDTKVLQKLRFLLGATVVSMGIPFHAHAEFYLHPWENHWIEEKRIRLTPEVNYATSKNNFDDQGNKIIPSGFDDFTRVLMDTHILLGLTSKLSIYGRLSWGRTQVAHVSQGGESFGFTDQRLGVNLKLIDQPHGFRIHFQGQADFGLYDNDKAISERRPPLGDGTKDFTFGLFGAYSVYPDAPQRLILVAGPGLSLRSDNFHKLLVWSAGLQYQAEPQQGAQVGIALTGQLPIGDEPPRDPTLNPCANSLAGGSCMVGAIHPKLAVARIDAGYRFNPSLALQVHYDQAIFGSRSPNFFILGFGAQFTWGETPPPAPAAQISPVEYGKSNQGFVGYREALEARISRVNDRLHLLRIDKGQADGVQVGEVFDIFSVRPNGTIIEAVARAKVTSLKDHEAALRIVEFYREVWIEEGFLARRPVQ